MIVYYTIYVYYLAYSCTYILVNTYASVHVIMFVFDINYKHKHKMKNGANFGLFGPVRFRAAL